MKGAEPRPIVAYVIVLVIIIIVIINRASTGCPISRYLFSAPEYPQDFSFELKYGVGARNILDTEKETFTQDMILDRDITIKLVLSDSELETIWKSIIENDFYNLSEQSEERASSVSPALVYTLTVSADQYPETTVSMVDLQLHHTSDELKLLRITETILEIIESKPAYKALPEPRGGYA